VHSGISFILCFYGILQAFARLTELIERRGEAYANSDVKVSLQKIAAELGIDDVSALTPTTIARVSCEYKCPFFSRGTVSE
jgi:hypothetical protein